MLASLFATFRQGKKGIGCAVDKKIVNYKVVIYQVYSFHVNMPPACFVNTNYCIVSEPISGFRIAFNMFDTDGDQRVDKKEFLVVGNTFYSTYTDSTDF